MPDVFNAVEIEASNADKILKHLEKIKESQTNSAELSEAIASAMKEFSQFFLSYGESYFTAHNLYKNQTPESSIYNENMESLSEDLERLYKMVSFAAGSSLTAYNYSSVVSNEIKNAAELSASKVLDLNILNDFVKGTTIVAGDDFINGDKVDKTYAVETSKAELVYGASAMGLKPVDVKVVSTPDTKITITPVMPGGAAGKVNTQPTPQNLERFYEGQFYAPIGQQKPEGGQLNITYIADPTFLPSDITSTSTNGGDAKFTATVDSLGIDPVDITPEIAQQINGGSIGFFAILPSSESSKEAIRKKMLDGNPDTWWECEYVFKSEPLIDPFKLSTDDVISEIGSLAENNEDGFNG